MNGSSRGRILRRAADIVRDRADELSILECKDNGQPLSQAAYGHFHPSADCIEQVLISLRKLRFAHVSCFFSTDLWVDSVLTCVEVTTPTSLELKDQAAKVTKRRVKIALTHMPIPGGSH